MKKLLIALVCCAFAAMPIQQTHAGKNANAFRFFSIGVNVYNGTNSNASIYLYGPSSVSGYINAYSGASFGPITAGTYYVNMYTSASGTHTFYFNGQSVTTSTGSATFSNVSITGTASASIY